MSVGFTNQTPTVGGTGTPHTVALSGTAGVPADPGLVPGDTIIVTDDGTATGAALQQWVWTDDGEWVQASQVDHSWYTAATPGPGGEAISDNIYTQGSITWGNTTDGVTGGNVNTGVNSAVGGRDNNVSAADSLVTGRGNTVSGEEHTVGGEGNEVDGFGDAAVFGRLNKYGRARGLVVGSGNDIQGTSDDVIVGGNSNLVSTSGERSLIVGLRNNVRSTDSSVSGQDNESAGVRNVVGGGSNVVTGGGDNIAVGNSITLTGTQSAGFGISNSSAANFTLTSGNRNRNDAEASVVGGNANVVEGNAHGVFGQNNNVSGILHLTAGRDHTVAGDDHMVSGLAHNVSGFRNVALGRGHTLTGSRNTGLGFGCTINGNINMASGQNITINNGVFNVGMGQAHNITGVENAVLGTRNIVNGGANFVACGDNEIISDATFSSNFNTVLGHNNTISLTSNSAILAGSGITGNQSNTAYAFRFSVGAGGYQSFSDRRVKENIKDLDVGLKEVLALNPKRFDMKDYEVEVPTLSEGDKDSMGDTEYKYAMKSEIVVGNKDVMGLIAQDVEKVIPSIVQKNAAGIGDVKDVMTVDYVSLVPALINAVKELNARIEELEAR